MFDWINSRVELIGLILALTTIIWGAWQYIVIKRAEERQRRFETYHSLIRDLVDREDPGRPLMLDRQLAIVFELRKFPEYYEPTLRILIGLKETWSVDHGPPEKRPRLIAQMESTILFIRSRPFIRCRLKNAVHMPVLDLGK